MFNLSPSPKLITEIDHVFHDDIVDYFSDRRKGHIGPHAYPGKGGVFYDEWLATHEIYRELVTKPELILIEHFTNTASELFGDTVNFVEGGIGSLTAFRKKTLPLLIRIAQKRGHKIKYTVADIADGPFKIVQQYAEAEDLPFNMSLVHANMFSSLPKLEKNSAIWVSGITLSNPPVDAIKNSARKIYTDIFSYFHNALSEGGILAFSYANNYGIGADGKEIIQLYDHPLNHLYQLTIYERIAKELEIAGDYDPLAFANPLRFKWNSDQGVLTRHTHPLRRMQFSIGQDNFDLLPDFDGYHSNNFRPSDEQIAFFAKEAGFTDCRIFGLPNSNIRLAVLQHG